MYAQRNAGVRTVVGGLLHRHRSLAVALLVAAALGSTAPGLDLGLAVGSDGVSGATASLNSENLNSGTQPIRLPLAATALCDLHSGERFVLRVKAMYGVLQHRDSTAYGSGSPSTERDGLHAVRVQAAPYASIDVPGAPVYLQAGLGCGAHASWTQQTHYSGDFLTKATTRGLDATGLLAVGVRVNPHLTVELGMEQLIADWSVRTRHPYWRNDSSQVWQPGSQSDVTVLNLGGVIQPGYTAGIVWTR